MSKALDNVVVVAYGRAPVGRAYKGSLKNLHPVDLGAQVLKGVLAKIPALDPAMIDDVVVGCRKRYGTDDKPFLFIGSSGDSNGCKRHCRRPGRRYRCRRR